MFINTYICTMLSEWIKGTHTSNSLLDLSGGQSHTHSIYDNQWTYAIILIMLI